MLVEFLKKIPPGEGPDGKPHEPVEYIRFARGQLGADELCRRATDNDRSLFRVEYEAFNPKPKPAAVIVPEPPAMAESDISEPPKKSWFGKKGG